MTPAGQPQYLRTVEGGGEIAKTALSKSTLHECTTTFAIPHTKRRTRADPKRKHLSSELNIAKMYDLYLEKHERRVARAKRRRLVAGENVAAANSPAASSSEDDNS